MPSDHYDLIVIGSGPGGASLAHRLATTGKRILMLERGDYLPRSQANWDSQNLYIADASFFPSIGAVNPTLTIIANALRVADRIKERLGA